MVRRRVSYVSTDAIFVHPFRGRFWGTTKGTTKYCHWSYIHSSHPHATKSSYRGFLRVWNVPLFLEIVQGPEGRTTGFFNVIVQDRSLMVHIHWRGSIGYFRHDDDIIPAHSQYLLRSRLKSSVERAVLWYHPRTRMVLIGQPNRWTKAIVDHQRRFPTLVQPLHKENRKCLCNETIEATRQFPELRRFFMGNYHSTRMEFLCCGKDYDVLATRDDTDGDDG